MKDVPHLFLWGDFLESPVWRGNIMQAPARYHEALAAQGTASTWLELPTIGITGNTHMLMMDRNSDQLAGLVQTWMSQHGLMR